MVTPYGLSLARRGENRLARGRRQTGFPAAEKNKGTRGQLEGRDASGGRVTRPPEDETRTLGDLGVTKGSILSVAAPCRRSISTMRRRNAPGAYYRPAFTDPLFDI